MIFPYRKRFPFLSNPPLYLFQQKNITSKHISFSLLSQPLPFSLTLTHKLLPSRSYVHNFINRRARETDDEVNELTLLSYGLPITLNTCSSNETTSLLFCVLCVVASVFGVAVFLVFLSQCRLVINILCTESFCSLSFFPRPSHTGVCRTRFVGESERKTPREGGRKFFSFLLDST